MPSHTPSDRCTYRDTSGRRCRLPRKTSHPGFCAHHARISSAGTLEDPQKLAADILGTEIDFSDARALNRVAGKLLESFLSGRIPARHAAVAGYLCQNLIQTLPHIERQERLVPGSIEYQYVSNIPRPNYALRPQPPPNSADAVTTTASAPSTANAPVSTLPAAAHGADPSSPVILSPRGENR